MYPFSKKAKKQRLYLFGLSDKQAFTWLLSQDFDRNIATLKTRSGSNYAALQQIHNLQKLRWAYIQAQIAKVFFRVVAMTGLFIGAVGGLGIIGGDILTTGGSVTILSLVAAASANHAALSSLSAFTIASVLIGYVPSAMKKIFKLLFSSRHNNLTKIILAIHSSIRTNPEEINNTFNHMIHAPGELNGSSKKCRLEIGRTVKRSLAVIYANVFKHNTQPTVSNIAIITTNPTPLTTLYNNEKRKLPAPRPVYSASNGNKTDGVDAFLARLKEINTRNTNKEPKIILLPDPRSTHNFLVL